MIAGLNGSKMSSSDEQSKIDLLDAPELVSKKVKKAECFPKQPEGNGVLALIEHVLLPAAALKGKREVTVPRPDGEDLVYTDIEKMNADYAADIVRSISSPCTLHRTIEADHYLAYPSTDQACCRKGLERPHGLHHFRV